MPPPGAVGGAADVSVGRSEDGGAATDVLDFRDRAFLEYFQHPSYLALLQRTFGQDVADHVMEMCSHQVRRRHHDAAAMPTV